MESAVVLQNTVRLVYSRYDFLFQIRRVMAETEEPQIYKKRYKIDKKLGAGNFGTAYLVTDLRAKQEP